MPPQCSGVGTIYQLSERSEAAPKGAANVTVAWGAMAREIRVYGDPVLKQKAAEITDIDGKLVRLADEMLSAMYAAPGLGLAAPQVGVQKQLFVYDLQDETGPHTLVNPTIVESRGEWVYDEGCLSIPGLYVEIARPKEVHLRGVDMHGEPVQIVGTELMARCLQHETDHLDGVLFMDRMRSLQSLAFMEEYRRFWIEDPE